MPGYIGTERPLKQKINNKAKKEPWPLAKCCKCEAFCWRYKPHVCYPLSRSSGQRFLQGFVCVRARVCFGELTRTSSCGNGPREFSGTLIGGMTQSLFMRLSWLSVFRDGNAISFKSFNMTGGTVTSWTCEKGFIFSSRSSGHNYAVKCEYIKQCWMVSPPHTEILMSQKIARWIAS